MSTVVLRLGPTVLIPHLGLAMRLDQRIKGLLGRDSLPPGQGLYLKPCSCIHTFGMRFTIDVIYVDRNLVITKVGREIAPNRIFNGGMGAHGAIEVASGWLMTDLEPAMQLVLDGAGRN